MYYLLKNLPTKVDIQQIIWCTYYLKSQLLFWDICKTFHCPNVICFWNKFFAFNYKFWRLGKYFFKFESTWIPSELFFVCPQIFLNISTDFGPMPPNSSQISVQFWYHAPNSLYGYWFRFLYNVFESKIWKQTLNCVFMSKI